MGDRFWVGLLLLQPLWGSASDLPFRFEANLGQAGPETKYLARGNGFLLSLEGRGTTLKLHDAALRTRFLGANKRSSLDPLDPLPVRTNYLVGADPAAWRRNVPTYSRVRYRQLYPGIDLVFYGREKRLEYDFDVAPGADPASIQFEVNGARGMRVDASGDLVLLTSGGEVRWLTPVIYQMAGGVRRQVAGRFALKGKRRVAFQIERYDTSSALVIDPALSYSTYFGGLGNDSARAIAADSAGNVYLAGSTTSTNLSTTGSSLPTVARPTTSKPAMPSSPSSTARGPRSSTSPTSAETPTTPRWASP